MPECDPDVFSQRNKIVRARILHIAKGLLAGQIGVIEASRELASLRHDVNGELADVLLRFAGIASETDSLPVGQVRQHWNPESLKAKDVEIEKAERLYRESAVNAATELLRFLEIPS